VSKEIEPRCGFCGVSQNEAAQLVKGLGSFICDACVYDCLGVIEDSRKSDRKTFKAGSAGKSRPTPSQIKKHLDEYIIGQDKAKKILAVAVYNHYKRIHSKSEVEINKSNILLVGPTGSGKTYTLETIARFLDVPFAIADATTMTEAGYVGEDVESVLVRLVQNANGDIKKAEHGIVYIDEIDKIAASDGGSKGRDISGEGVQQGLLKLMEGSIVSINPQGKKTANAPTEMIDTKNILFVCGGAFSGITQEKHKKRALGIINSKAAKEKDDIKAKDIVKYGMIPEFVGRLPVIAQLDSLSTEDLKKILVEPKNALIKQYQELLSMDGVNLKFKEEFIEEVAKRAQAEGTGARGLRAIIEPALTELMYKLPDEEAEQVEVGVDTLPPEEDKKNG
jgi:ATP-dependent Clp protease ATP-binding subunit ClpX